MSGRLPLSAEAFDHEDITTIRKRMAERGAVGQEVRWLATIDADRARIAELEAENGRLASTLFDAVERWATDPGDYDRCARWIAAGCPPKDAP